MAEYKGPRARKRARGGATEGEGASSPPGHMIIMIGIGAKKKPKAGGKVEGAGARGHLGKRARGGSPPQAQPNDQENLDRLNEFQAENRRQDALDEEYRMDHGGFNPPEKARGGRAMSETIANDPECDDTMAPKKRKKGGHVEGEGARKHMGKRARGGASPRSKALDAREDAFSDGLDKVSEGSGTDERAVEFHAGRLEGGPVMMSRGGYEPADSRKSGGRLTAEERHKMPANEFALPGGRYPVNDANHARNALARVSQFGSPEEKAKVRATVHRKFPTIGKE